MTHDRSRSNTADRLPTFDEDWNTALVIAAHPDDIEYGAAAAVARWTDGGKTVTYLLATHGEAGIDTLHPTECATVRAQEERDGAREVGVDVVEFLDHRDGTLEYGLPLRRDVARAVRTHRPEVVITLTHRERFGAGGTNQADHRVLGLAALDGARDAGNRWVFPELLDEGLEPWSGVRLVGFTGSPQPTHGVDVTDHVEPAIASLEAHAQYLAALGANYPSARDLLTGILRAGGEAVGAGFGVTFEVFEI